MRKRLYPDLDDKTSQCITQPAHSVNEFIEGQFSWVVSIKNIQVFNGELLIIREHLVFKFLEADYKIAIGIA